MKGRKASTLIEILAVIVILIAFIPPVFKGAREGARQASCLSNMREISLAFLMYSLDYGLTPPDVDTSQALLSLVENREVFHCPSLSSKSSLETTDEIPPGYAWNPMVLGIRPSDKIGSNFDTLMISEYIGDDSPLLPIVLTRGKKRLDTEKLSYRHLDSVNVAWLDGHVKEVGRDESEVVLAIISTLTELGDGPPGVHAISINGMAYELIIDDDGRATGISKIAFSPSKFEELAGISFEVHIDANGKASIEQLTQTVGAPSD